MPVIPAAASDDLCVYQIFRRLGMSKAFFYRSISEVLVALVGFNMRLLIRAVINHSFTPRWVDVLMFIARHAIA